MADKTEGHRTGDPGSMLGLLPTSLPMSQCHSFLDCMFFLSSGTSLSLETSGPNRHCHFPRLWRINGPLRNSESPSTSVAPSPYGNYSSPNLRDKFAFTFLILLHYQSLIHTPTGFSGLTLSSGCFPFWGTLATMSFGFISLKKMPSHLFAVENSFFRPTRS